jgi:hypothetical protein
VEVVYDSGGKRLVSRRVTMDSAEDQAEFLAQARERLPQGCQVVESCGSRVYHALKPFHVLVLFAMLAAGAHLFYTTDMFMLEDLKKPSGTYSLDAEMTWDDPQAAWGDSAWIDDDEWADMVAQSEEPEFRSRTVVPAVFARGLRRTRIGGMVILAAAAVAGILTMIGQAVAMTVLLSGVAGSLYWTVSRFSNPPRTFAVVVPQRR